VAETPTEAARGRRSQGQGAPARTASPNQWIKRELARLLGLGPADLHPLDFKSKRKLPLDDPRWRRAMWLSTLKGKEVHTVAGVRVKYRDGSLVD
jgi:hypothetical protein